MIDKRNLKTSEIWKFTSKIFTNVAEVHTGAQKGYLKLSKALDYIYWAQEYFYSSRNQKGLDYCRKYILRIKALQAFKRKDQKNLQMVLQETSVFEKRMRLSPHYQPSHTKTLIDSKCKLGELYLALEKPVKGVFVLEQANADCTQLLDEYPEYHCINALQLRIRKLITNHKIE